MLKHAELMEKIRNAPMLPGCYLYRDNRGYVIYVGKAKQLRSRVRQYFGKRPAGEDPKIERLARGIADVEYRVTDTERDALMLEYKLIKEYKPRFNAQLKGDPSPLYLHIDIRAQYPALTVTDATDEDGAERFAFFRDIYDAKKALELLCAVWKTPVCRTPSFDQYRRPCVNHQVGGCMGPCGRAVDALKYRAIIDEIIALFRGSRVNAFYRLNAEMRRHAAAFDFEKAASVKEQIDQLERLQRRGQMMIRFPEDKTVLVFFRAYRERGFCVFLVRNQKVLLREDFDGSAPDASAAERLCMRIQEAHTPIPDSEWLTGCLCEVFADKQFLILGEATSADEIGRAISDRLGDFCACAEH